MNTVHHKIFRKKKYFFIKLNKQKSNKIGQNFGKMKFSKNKIFVDKFDLIYWINGLALFMNART